MLFPVEIVFSEWTDIGISLVVAFAVNVFE